MESIQLRSLTRRNRSLSNRKKSLQFVLIFSISQSNPASIPTYITPATNPIAFGRVKVAQKAKAKNDFGENSPKITRTFRRPRTTAFEIDWIL